MLLFSLDAYMCIYNPPNCTLSIEAQETHSTGYSFPTYRCLPARITVIDMIDFNDSDSGFDGYFDVMNATMGTAIQTSVEAQNVKPTDAVIKYSVID